MAHKSLNRTSRALPALRKRLLITLVVAALAILTLSLRFGFRESPIPFIPIFDGPRPRVTLRQGTYIGSFLKLEAQTLEQFLGIPYALSTGGERRFKPPVPVDASTGTYDATTYGNVCPAGTATTAAPQDEDCLNVNVFRPKQRQSNRKLPVLIHIYGGAFNFGSSLDRRVDNMVAWSEEPFIAVAFNYRLGAFGFLPSKLAQKEGLLNAGLKDQALLLQWVQDNIAEFGGDPNDVTLMGSSAGAHSIGHHVLHNTEEKPLFHKAIMESGGPTARACYTATNKIHEQQFREFLTMLDCQKVPEDEIIQTLRGFTTAQIKYASEAVYSKYNPSVRWPWQPVIDGEGGMIPIRPIDSWRAGKFHKIPILTGFNTNEGAMFTPKNLATSKDFRKFFRTLLPGLSNNDLGKLQKVYPDPLTDPSSKYLDTRIVDGLGPEFKRAEQAYAHFAYVAPVKHTAHFVRTDGDRPVFLYHFDVNSSVVGGADHGSGGGYPTYNEDIVRKSDTIGEIAGLMHAYWTSFITTGNPNEVKGKFEDRPQWPAYTLEGGKLIMFGDGNDEIAGGDNAGTAVKIVEDTWAVEECKYWWDRTEKFEF